jgi:hypothetical protein
VKCREGILHTVYQISIFHVSFSPWNEVLFEKLIVDHLARKFPKYSVQHLEGSSIGSYFDLNESCPILPCYYLTFKRPAFTYANTLKKNTPEINFTCLSNRGLYCILRHAA